MYSFCSRRREEDKMPKFGVARKYAKDLPNYISILHQNKIDAYEMGFAYGIPSSLPEKIIEFSKRYNVHLSAHLPFWINLGNNAEEKNVNYLVSGLKISEQLGGIVVFHLGFYGKKRFNELKENIVRIIQEALNLSGTKNGIMGIETTGRQKEIGTIDEIIQIIKLINSERVIPVIDWSHLYSRSNGTYPYSIQDFKEVLEKFEENLGYRPSYFHGGGVEYKWGNEVRHVSAKTFEPPLPYLFKALKDLGYSDFTFIVESPDSIEDVKWLKQVWHSPEDYLENIPNKKPKTLLDWRRFNE
jgi:deoxyribonuclease-4